MFRRMTWFWLRWSMRPEYQRVPDLETRTARRWRFGQKTVYGMLLVLEDG
jgi:hypothetical protein